MRTKVQDYLKHEEMEEEYRKKERDILKDMDYIEINTEHTINLLHINNTWIYEMMYFPNYPPKEFSYQTQLAIYTKPLTDILERYNTLDRFIEHMKSIIEGTKVRMGAIFLHDERQEGFRVHVMIKFDRIMTIRDLQKVFVEYNLFIDSNGDERYTYLSENCFYYGQQVDVTYTILSFPDRTLDIIETPSLLYVSDTLASYLIRKSQMLHYDSFNRYMNNQYSGEEV